MQFEKGIVDDINISPKKSWSYVKSKMKTRSKIPVLVKEDGTETVTASEKALKRYFSSNFTDKKYGVTER